MEQVMGQHYPTEEPEEVPPLRVMDYIQEFLIHSIVDREDHKPEEEQQQRIRPILHHRAHKVQAEPQPHIMEVAEAAEVIMEEVEDQIMEAAAEAAVG